jgi:N-acetylmuramoyl-L-alanine amidase
VTETHLSSFTAIAALLLSASVFAQAPQPTQAAPVPATQPSLPVLPKQLPNFYRNLIVIDPAHGGSDRGAQLPNGVAEKDVTLAFAQKLRPALVAQGFTVAGTRDSDPSDVLASDQRAGTANHARPLACLLLHATATGSGIHVATSSLERSVNATAHAVRWSDAQATSLDVSLRLANEIGLALSNAHLPVVLLRASVPPIDNLTCAASVIEIAPQAPSGGNNSAVTDAAYQQRVADAIALGLASFRTHNAPAPTSSPAAAPAAPVRPAPAAPAQSAGSVPASAPKPASAPAAPQPAAKPAPKERAPR